MGFLGCEDGGVRLWWAVQARKDPSLVLARGARFRKNYTYVSFIHVHTYTLVQHDINDQGFIQDLKEALLQVLQVLNSTFPLVLNMLNTFPWELLRLNS